jgi:hypothetical protein
MTTKEERVSALCDIPFRSPNGRLSVQYEALFLGPKYSKPVTPLIQDRVAYLRILLQLSRILRFLSYKLDLTRRISPPDATLFFSV